MHIHYYHHYDFLLLLLLLWRAKWWKHQCCLHRFLLPYCENEIWILKNIFKTFSHFSLLTCTMLKIHIHMFCVMRIIMGNFLYPNYMLAAVLVEKDWVCWKWSVYPFRNHGGCKGWRLKFLGTSLINGSKWQKKFQNFRKILGRKFILKRNIS